MRHEPLQNQKVDLAVANFVPQPADGFTVPASLHLRLQRCLVVVTADRHGLSPALPVPFLHADCVFRIEALRHVSTFALYRLESMYEGAKRDRINQRPTGLASPHPTLPRLRGEGAWGVIDTAVLHRRGGRHTIPSGWGTRIG